MSGKSPTIGDFTVSRLSQILPTKAWFSYVGKIPDDRGFSFLRTIPDFADFLDNLSQILKRRHVYCDGGLGPRNLGDW